MKTIVIVGVFIPALLFISTNLFGQTANITIKWNNDLKLPACVGMTENKGLAGVFSGITENNLIIAGGANFPDNTPWNGGHKTWWRTLYHINLDKPDRGWNVINNALPEAVAYGVSVTLPEGLLCIGGCGEKQCFNTVYLIHNITFALSMQGGIAGIEKISDAIGALQLEKNLMSRAV